MADDWSKHVHPHGPLEAVSEGVWAVQGSLPRGGIPRRMVVWRRDDGGLVAHSVVAMDDARMAELDALGPLAAMIVPNGIHRADAAVWKARYPGAKVYAPALARAAVEKVVPVDATVEDAGGALGASVLGPDGIKRSEYVYVARGTWVFADVMMNLPKLPGLDGWLFGVLGSTGFFGITGIGRMALLTNRAAFKAWLGQAAESPPSALLPAHGNVLTTDTGAALRAAAARL